MDNVLARDKKEESKVDYNLFKLPVAPTLHEENQLLKNPVTSC